MHEFAERFDMPVATSYRRLPLFDAFDRIRRRSWTQRKPEASQFCAGQRPACARRRAHGRNSFAGLSPAGYSFARMTFVHVYPQAEEFGRVYSPSLAIHATPKAFAKSLRDIQAPPHCPGERRHGARIRIISTFLPNPRHPPRSISPRVMMWLSDNLPAEAIICNGAGNYASWIHRYYASGTSPRISRRHPRAWAMESLPQWR